MRTVTFSVASWDQVTSRAVAAFRGKPQGSWITFASLELMWKTLTPKRWDVLKAMSAQGPMSIRELARRLDRDVKAVHGDVQALIVAGVLRKTDDGQIEFPFDRIKVKFELEAA